MCINACETYKYEPMWFVAVSYVALFIRTGVNSDHMLYLDISSGQSQVLCPDVQHHFLHINSNIFLVLKEPGLVGWCTACCSFQRDGPAIFGLLTALNFLLGHFGLRLGLFSLSHFYFSLSLALEGVWT